MAGCYDPTVQSGVPCAADGSSPTGQECDPVTIVCMGPTQLVTWRDDTAADFAQAGAVLTEAVVEPAGFVGPAPYLTGRIRLAGIENDTIGTIATATWESASAGTIAGQGLSDDLSINYGDLTPLGLGLAAGDNVTVLLEGELLLDAPGVWQFELEANDKGFIDLAPPGGEFARLVSDDNTGTLVSYTVTTPGWHRIRGAFADLMLDMELVLTADSPVQGGGLNTIRRDSVRARVDDLTGYVVDVFEDSYLVEHVGSTLETQPLDRTFAGADPYGMPIGALSYTLRYSAQILIDVAGDYSFTVDSHHGHRVWLDGMELSNLFDDAPHAITTTPVSLEPGWHDFAADITKGTDRVRRAFRCRSRRGPQASGSPFPPIMYAP